uniref:Uncharacterized protein n=1 Tax=Arundo donax TaxID=35708 RepID=A0A0A9DH97_ARUDO
MFTASTQEKLKGKSPCNKVEELLTLYNKSTQLYL